MSDARGFPGTVGRLVAVLQGRLRFLFTEHQARLPWARAILSFDQVPDVYKRPFEALVGDLSSFPYTVHVPPYIGLADRLEGKLLFCLGGDIHVLEEVSGELTSVCYPVDKISYVEMGLALLYAWFIVRGVNTGGVVSSTEFRFNSVTDHLFTPIVDSIRSVPVPPQRVDPAVERRKFDYLAKPNLKLRNYSRRSLAPDEQVIQNIYQPEVRVGAPRPRAFSFLNTLAAAHIAILTDRELILIQDGADKRLGRGVLHGGVWDYIPLDKITSVSLAETRDSQLTLSIDLPGDDRIEREFSASLRPELETLVSRFGTAPQGKASRRRSAQSQS